MSLLVVGSIALDSIFTPFGETADALGGSAVYFSVAGSILHPVQVVGVVGKDYPYHELERLASRGIDWSGVERVEGESFRWKGKYSYDLQSRETLETRLGVFADFQPKLPAAFRSARFLFLGNIDPELQIRVLDQAERPRLVCADTMNYWINSRRPELLKLLPRVDVLMVNDSEVRQLAGESNVMKAAHAAQRMGAKSVVIKRGEYGAMLVTAEHRFFAPAFPLTDVVDPTGAGDSFAGGFLGLLDRLESGEPTALRQATVMGSTIASFTVERFSLDRLRDLDLGEVRRRYDAFRHLVHFDALPDQVG
jgi:sugar/nucleoside kinase (ribokinase family)